MFAPENEWMLKAAQEAVDEYWARLEKEEACFAPAAAEAPKAE